MIILEWCIFDLYTKVWIRGFGLQLFFLLQREMQSVPNIVFFLNYDLPCLSRSYEGPNCSPSTLMENNDHTISPVLLTPFLYDLAYKVWLF